MEKVFEAKEELLKVLGWTDNPFVKDLRLEDKDDFLKYYYPLESARILKKLAFDTKACMLLGPKGVGKTSALYFVMYSLPERQFLPVLFKQPPESLGELGLEIGVGHRGLLSKIRSLLGPRKAKGLTRTEIAQRIKSFNRTVVFFLDEAHLEGNKEMYMEFKYLLDEVPNLRMVVSALGRENFPDSLVQLVGEGNVFSRSKFTSDEMKEIVRHRIGAVGGRGFEPFEDEVLQKVFTEQNLLTPRYVFDELNNYLADLALDELRLRKVATRLAVLKEWEQKDAQRAAERHREAGKKGAAGAAAPAQAKQQAGSLEQQYAHDSLIASVLAEPRTLRVQEGAKLLREEETATAAGDGLGEGASKAGAREAAESGAASSLSFLTTIHAEWWVQLSPSQQAIMGLLLSPQAGGGISLAQIMRKTALAQNTAFNALYQLRGDDQAEIQRKPSVPFPLVTVSKQLVGNKKRNIYSANEKIRNLFTMT